MSEGLVDVRIECLESWAFSIEIFTHGSCFRVILLCLCNCITRVVHEKLSICMHDTVNFSNRD
jgi:hypothetical protein